MQITTRPATDEDSYFARDAHHLGYRDVVTSQFGSCDKAVRDQFFLGSSVARRRWDQGWVERRSDVTAHR